MAGAKQPIDVVIANGRKHLTKQEIEDRRNGELTVNLKNIQTPSYLPSKLKKEFVELSNKLLEVGIMTELDEDCLARYLISKDKYNKYTKMLNKAIKSENFSAMESLTSMQDKAFKQCRSCATDLGLTIASRCRLVVPPSQNKPQKNKFVEKFGSG